MKKKKLGLHVITGAVLIAVGIPSAFAADATPIVKEVRTTATGVSGGSRIIVRYNDAAAGDSAAKLATVQSAVTRANLGKAGVSANGVTGAALNASQARTLATGAELIRLSNKLSGVQLDKLVAELSADPSVQYAEVDVRLQHTGIVATPVTTAALVQPQFTPSDPYYGQYQWHFSNATGGINAPAAWDINQGEGVVVAVLDTGILPNHPDMSANLLTGYDFITDTFVSRRPTAERVPGAQDYGDWNDDASQCDVSTSSWHGTHTSGTVAEVTNNSIGMAGVAYKAKILPVRVLGRCGGYTSDIADAIIWASGGTVAGVADNQNPAEVINMSLGGNSSCDATTQAAINSAVSRGTTVVVSAGNSAANAGNFTPASCANVVTVGATRITGGITYYSNYGAVVDLSAPGGGASVDGNPNGYVWQAGSNSDTTPDAGSLTYMGMAGTSMSAPHVSAVVALLQSARVAAGSSTLTPAEAETLLKQTARTFPVTIPASTPIGAGIVDAKAALDKALEVPCTENCGPVATPLVNKVPVTRLSGYAGQETLYSFEAKAGAVLSILTYGGTGNVSLYVSFGKEPTAASNDAKSVRPGNSETVRFTAPKAGTYYIKLVGASAYSGVTLEARQ